MERCTLKEHGFVGAYYPGTRARNKAVIAVGGASCDEKTSVAMCRYLREAGYLAYACDGDMRSSTGEQRTLMRMASREAYAMLRAQGILILPENDDKFYAPGFRGSIMQFLYFVMAKNKTVGDLVACEHCRNAYEEMELLAKAFEQVIARTPDYPMPSWQALKAQMPDWEAVRERFGAKKA